MNRKGDLKCYGSNSIIDEVEVDIHMLSFGMIDQICKKVSGAEVITPEMMSM